MAKKKQPQSVAMKSGLQFDSFIDPYAIKDLVSSKTYKKGQWRSLTALQDFTNGIQKSVLPIDITEYKILVLSQVAPGRLIKAHKHDDEPQFRYIISGSFKLNGETYHAGDWVIVPQGYDYEIYTETGYSTFAGYGMSCQCSSVGGH
jgi:quercetin dioxygenase-like cupin family protein